MLTCCLHWPPSKAEEPRPFLPSLLKAAMCLAPPEDLGLLFWDWPAAGERMVMFVDMQCVAGPGMGWMNCCPSMTGLGLCLLLALIPGQGSQTQMPTGPGMWHKLQIGLGQDNRE